MNKQQVRARLVERGSSLSHELSPKRLAAGLAKMSFLVDV